MSFVKNIVLIPLNLLLGREIGARNLDGGALARYKETILLRNGTKYLSITTLRILIN